MKAYLIILIVHAGFNSRHCTPLCTFGSHLQVILEQSWWWLDGGIFRGGGGQCLRISLPSSVRKRSYQTLTDGTPRQRQQVVTFCALYRYSYPNKVTQRKLGWRCFPRVAQANSPQWWLLGFWPIRTFHPSWRLGFLRWWPRLEKACFRQNIYRWILPKSTINFLAIWKETLLSTP